MNEQPKQVNVNPDVLLLRQLEEVESCGQACHSTSECGSMWKGCPFPFEVERPSE